MHEGAGSRVGAKGLALMSMMKKQTRGRSPVEGSASA
jgi:hypothetical protein